MPFDQRSLVHWEVPFPRWDKHTTTHTNTGTSRLIEIFGLEPDSLKSIINIQCNLIFSRAGQSQGLLYKTTVVHNLVSKTCCKMPLGSLNVYAVRYRASNNKID